MDRMDYFSCPGPVWTVTLIMKTELKRTSEGEREGKSKRVLKTLSVYTSWSETEKEKGTNKFSSNMYSSLDRTCRGNSESVFK